MAKLTAKTRNALPSKTFALPGRRYPIPDRSHAIAAKSRVTQFGSPAEKAKVRSAVARKFPGLGSSSSRKPKTGQYRNHSQTRAKRRG